MEQFSNLNYWFTKLVCHKNDTPGLILRKKFFLVTNLLAIFFISCLTALAYLLELRHFAVYLWMLLTCNLVLTMLLVIFRKWSGRFAYAAYSIYLILIFYIIIKLGGLANSAGLLMAAYFFLLTAQWMEDIRLLLFIGVLYVVGVLVTGISYPYQTFDATLTGWKNNLFFVINYAWIGLLLAVALYSTLVRSESDAKSRAQQLQEMDLLKSQLYANIAHEFRTPLTLIRGNAEEIGELHDRKTRDRASSIIHNSNKILFLVNQMLNLSRIEEGGVPVHYVQSDLVAFIRYIVNSFQGYAESRHIGLHYHPLCSQLVMDLEPDKLEESISNLLSNALKYTPEGGEVTVAVRLQEGTGKEPQAGPQQVEISVRDTGIGIPEDQLDKIFIRFYRVEDKRYPYQEGTGIGLTLVSEYLKLMKGTISVKSRQGEGSEFVVLLPVTRNAGLGDAVPAGSSFRRMEPAPATTPGRQDLGTNRPRLLLIEDNKELIGYLAGLLEGDYHLLTAMDGNEGVKLATEHIPDMVLSDVMMPGKSGYQVCRELKNDFRTSHIPVVLLTARADTESRISGMEHGADAYLTKPFDRKELMACLNNLFLQREMLRLRFNDHHFEKRIPGSRNGLNESFLIRVTRHLEKNFANDGYGIKNLHSDMALSRVQLHRKLTALTGQSASNFIRNFRLGKARKLLLETDRTVSEIACEVGFSDTNYFSKAFIREFGITATEFRESFR